MAKRKNDILNSLGPSIFGADQPATVVSIEPEKRDNNNVDAPQMSNPAVIDSGKKNDSIAINESVEKTNDKIVKTEETVETIEHEVAKETKQKSRSDQPVKRPKPKKNERTEKMSQVTSVEFPWDIYKKLKLIALEYGVNLKDIIIECVEEGIKKYKI